jgi:pyruvate dehydrogenase E1 component alpha subunit
MPVHQVDDSDVFKLRDLAASAVVRMRRGEGPSFIECRTYRWREHVGPNEDYDQGYRAREDLNRWLKDDQVERVARMIADERRTQIDAEIEIDIADAVEFAETSPFPEIDKLYTNVFAST